MRDIGRRPAGVCWLFFIASCSEETPVIIFSHHV